MNGAVFIETLKRNWRQMFYPGIGLGVLGYYTVVIIPNVDTLKSYQQLIETMPPVLLQAFGATDVSIMATPEGFIAFGFLTYALLILLVYSVLAGLNLTANEEDEGIMDMLLSLPLPRWRIIVEKYAVFALMTIGIVVLSYAGLYVGAVTGTLKFDMGLIMSGGINIILGLLLVMAFTAFVTTIVRRKSTATVIVVSVIVASYFINFLGNVASGTSAEVLRNFSFFMYADAQYVVTKGFSITSVLILLAGTIVFLGGALRAWENRDVGI